MSELKARTARSIADEEEMLELGADCPIEQAQVYLKSEADKVIEKITECAISMFRNPDNCRGLDLKSPLGKIANAGFKHWNYVELIQSRNTQLQEDKERLLQNNYHLLDEVERLKEDVADARQKVCEYQETINETERRERHQKHKRCIDKAKLCESEEKRLDAIAPLFDNDKECWEYSSDFLSKWARRWLKIAEQFKEEK